MRTDLIDLDWEKIQLVKQSKNGCTLLPFHHHGSEAKTLPKHWAACVGGNGGTLSDQSALDLVAARSHSDHNTGWHTIQIRKTWKTWLNVSQSKKIFRNISKQIQMLTSNILIQHILILIHQTFPPASRRMRFTGSTIRESVGFGSKLICQAHG